MTLFACAIQELNDLNPSGGDMSFSVLTGESSFRNEA